MAKDKPADIKVKHYATHKVITQPNPLRRVIRQVDDADADDPEARAEKALEGLSSEFKKWMRIECDRLTAAHAVILKKGFNKASGEELFRAAHDIKGEAATFGFPWVAALADSLCRLLEHTPEAARIPITLVDQHVDAVRAVVRESARPDIATVAEALTLRLREVTEEFLAHENRNRPDYLDDILAPPIVPGEM